MASNDIKFIKTTYDKMSGYPIDGKDGVGEAYPNSIIRVADSNGDKKDLFIGSERMTDNYNSNAEDEWNSVNVGGLTSQKASELKGKSMSELMDAILFPTLTAEITQPVVTGSCSISNGVIEIGATLPTVEEVKNACSFTKVDRGSSKYGVLDGENNWVKGEQPYAGEEQTRLIYVVQDVENKTVAQEGANKYTITYSATFENGYQPTNNKGAVDGDPFEVTGGIVYDTSTLTLTGIYPMFCNGAWISTTETAAVNAAWLETPAETPVKKIENTNSVAVSFAPQTMKDGAYQEPFRIYLHGKSVESIETLSDLSGKWDANTNRGSFVKNGTKTFTLPNGEPVIYDIWESVLEGTGNAKIKFKLKNA